MQAKVSELYNKYGGLYDSLLSIIRESEMRVIAEEQDSLFSENVNFFIKSYMINICSYLEAYLQDIALELANDINERVKIAKIPHNFLYWNMRNDLKDKNLKFENANFPAEMKNISDTISANPHKTIKAYRLLGIDLTLENDFNENKDLINSVVIKRNNIIHHNDSAMDVSFGDLALNIDSFKRYMRAIQSAIINISTSTE